MKNRKIVKHILVLVWCVVIFLFSSENSEISDSKSKNIVNHGVEIYEKISDTSLKKKDKVIDHWNYILRKVTHYSIYFILGVLVFICFKEYSISLKQVVLFSILFCFLYAITDEFHQLFTSGRSARIFDIGIDTLGSVSSIFILFLWSRFKFRIEQK